jgi:type II secretory pathway pseudopilin PulG
MKRQNALAGYTIIEVLIFLAVSGGLLVSVMTLVSGQQQKTQFTTGVRDFESKMQDLINDVETGFFPSSSDLGCSVTGMETNSAARPQVVDSSSREQGTNQDCVFLGKAIQFYRGSGGEVTDYRAMTIAGKRLDFNTTENKAEEPNSLEEAVPTPFYVSGRNSGLDTSFIPNGVEVTKVKYVTGYDPVSYDESLEELAIVPSIALKKQNNKISNLGNGRASLAALDGDSNFNDNLMNDGGLFKSIPTLSGSSVDKASKGVVICLREAGGGRPAALTIGMQLDHAGSLNPQAGGQKLSTDIYFDNDARVRLGCST